MDKMVRLRMITARCVTRTPRTVSALLLPLAVTTGALAQDYPSRPVRMMVPFAAGGPADYVGRLFSQRLTELWGKQVVVDNRAGAAGIIGTEIAIRSNPDGHTVLFGSTSTFAVNLVLMKDLPYDVFRDLQLIGLVANAPHVLAVRANLPAANVKELIALANRQPGKLTFASAGAGTIVQMGGELFKYHAKIDILHVPFKSGAGATIGLLSGETDLLVNDLSAVLTHVKSGKLRALAAAHPTRLAPLPDVPSFAELGYPDIVSSTWWGIAVPVKTPRPIVDALSAAHAKVVRTPAYVAQLGELAMESVTLDRAQAATFIRREIDKWRTIAAAAKVTVE